MSRSGMNCATGCWLLAAGIGFIALVLMLVFGTIGWVGAFFLAGVVFVALGLLFNWLFCRPAPSPTEARYAQSADYNASRAATPGTGAPTGGAATTTPEQETAARAAAGPVAGKPAARQAPKPDAPAETAAKTAAPPSSQGARPEALSAPRGGAADDLKLIKGVGPKLEQLLNSLGVYHFDQIAGWTADEVAWVDANLKGFKGRVSRDNWIDQANLLAGGGETEFSRRAKDGDVY